MEHSLGITLEALAHTIQERREADETSYTFRLLQGDADKLLKKVMEEAGEVALASKDLESALRASKVHDTQSIPEEMQAFMQQRCEKARDHLRYELADVFYHALVLLERYDISLDDLAAELNTRMNADERPAGARTIEESRINRGH